MLTEIHMAFPEHRFILDKGAGLHTGYAYWGSTLLPDTAATSWNCCASDTLGSLSQLCCPIWPSAVISHCSQKIALYLPPDCHCQR